MIPAVFIKLIIPALFLLSLSGVAVYKIWKAAVSGVISYGYKYYKPEQICRRNENPLGYWLGITLYALGIVVSIILLITIC